MRLRDTQCCSGRKTNPGDLTRHLHSCSCRLGLGSYLHLHGTVSHHLFLSVSPLRQAFAHLNFQTKILTYILIYFQHTQRISIIKILFHILVKMAACPLIGLVATKWTDKPAKPRQG